MGPRDYPSQDVRAELVVYARGRKYGKMTPRHMVMQARDHP